MEIQSWQYCQHVKLCVCEKTRLSQTVVNADGQARSTVYNEHYYLRFFIELCIVAQQKDVFHMISF